MNPAHLQLVLRRASRAGVGPSRTGLRPANSLVGPTYRIRIAGVALACAHLPSTVCAQDAAKPAPVPAVASQVTVQGARIAPGLQVLGPTQVLSAEELRKYGAATLAESLARVPGVSVIVGAKGNVELSLGSLSSGEVQILIDGQAAPRGFAISSIALESVDRVEIVKASSARVSAESIAGTINIVLKQGRREDVGLEGNAQLLSGTRLGLSFGLNWTHAVDTGVITTTLNGKSLQERQDSSLYFRGVVPAEAVSLRKDSSGIAQTEELAILTKYAFKLGQARVQSEIQLLHNAQEREFLETWGLLQAYETAPNRIKNPVTIQRDSARGVLGFDAGTPDVDGRWSGKATMSWTERVGDGRVLSQPDGILLSTAHQPSYERYASMALYFTRKYLQDQLVSLGVEGLATERTESDSARFEFGELLGEHVNHSKALVQKASAFMIYERPLGADLRGAAGIRSDHVQVRSTVDGFDNVESRVTKLAPSLELSWTPTAETSVKAATGTALRIPQADEVTGRTYFATFNSLAEPDYVGNPSLKAEFASKFDAELQHQSGGLQLTARGEYRRIKDVILPEYTLAGHRWLNRPGNAGTADYRGLEMGGRYTLTDLSTPGLTAEVGLMLQESKYTLKGNGETTAFRTPQTATFSIDLRHTQGVSVGVSIKGSTSGDEPTVPGVVVRTGRQTVVDLFVGSRTSWGDLRLVVANAAASDAHREYLSSLTSVPVHESAREAGVRRLRLQANFKL